MKALPLVEKAFHLQKSPLFQDLDLDLLLAIGEKAQALRVDSGDEIFAYGQVGNHIYFIVEGELELRDETGTPIAQLGVGDCFGDEAIFTQSSRSFAAYALRQSSLLSLTRAHLYGVISEFPMVAISLLQHYSRLAGGNRHKI